MLLLNPRRRRRKSKARRRAGRRKMSALQLKYFGKGRKRSASPRRRRRHSSARRRSRRSAVVLRANPSRRRRRRGSSVKRAFSSVRRRLRGARSSATVRASLGYVLSTAKNAIAGGAGAIFADFAYGQVLNYAPASIAPKIASKFSENGGVNLAYYGAKLATVTALGVLAQRFAPAGLRGYVARGVEGAYVVSAYEVIRLMLPANIALAAYGRRGGRGVGFNNPARVLPATPGGSATRLGAYSTRRLAGMGRLGSASSGSGSMYPRHGSYSDGRIGEAPVL